MSFTKVSIFSVATTMLLASSATSAFAPQLPSSQLMKPPASVTSMTGPLFLAGFGSSKSNGKGKAKGKSKSTDGKLKPKQQWDRYLDMKRSQKKAVAVRIEGTEEWIEVGKVKSNEDMYTELAVARQRALIAEVSTHYFTLGDCKFYYFAKTDDANLPTGSISTPNDSFPSRYQTKICWNGDIKIMKMMSGYWWRSPYSMETFQRIWRRSSVLKGLLIQPLASIACTMADKSRPTSERDAKRRKERRGSDES